MQLTRTLPLFFLILFSLVLTASARRRGDGFARDLVQDVVKRSTELQTMAQANLFADPLVRVVPPKSKAKATCPSGSDGSSGSSSGMSSSPSQTTPGSPTASTEPSSSSSSSSNSNSDPNSNPNSISNPDSSPGSSSSSSALSQQIEPPTVTTVLVQPSGSAQNQSPANAQQSSAARRNMSTFGVLSMGASERMNAVIVVISALVVGFRLVV